MVLSPIPDALNFEQAAAFPLVSTTGAQLIERAANVQQGQTILITGAAGSAAGRFRINTAFFVLAFRSSKLVAPKG